MDLYFSEDGDLKISTKRDLAVTDTVSRDIAQQAYIRIMTEPSDWVYYPNLGAGLSRLYGMPQSEATAEFGKDLIREAFNREGRFTGYDIQISAVPTGPQSIRFDIHTTVGSRRQMIMSIDQDLGVIN